jgi:hypothetical protein
MNLQFDHGMGTENSSKSESTPLASLHKRLASVVQLDNQVFKEKVAKRLKIQLPKPKEAKQANQSMQKPNSAQSPDPKRQVNQ